MKKCYCCGADVPDQSKFCPKCGKPMAVTKDLIDRARSNDPEAQTELYERTYKTVYSRIRAKVPDEDTAMDIMQETYLHAFAGLDQLQTPETFPSWLLSIASREVCGWFRKNGKENENVQMSQLEYENDDTISDEDDLLDQPEYREDFSPVESLDRAETGRLLSEILDTLPEDQRIILTMRYYDELSLKEISEELGLNINTVKTRLTAGKKKVEAKVLELEKSGTKLYSLGPVAFLVFLLHHMELFAPVISANTVIGLSAAGAGAGGIAATAAHVTAATAAKTAAAAAAKGVSVKVIAIVAAAVVVVGGGVTAGVVVANNSSHQETAVVSETVEPSETPEPSESVEPIVIEPPSNDTVMEIAGSLDKWIANSDLGTEPIDLDLNTACQLAAVMISECGYSGDDGVTRTGAGDYDGYKSVISEETLDQCLHDLFGSGYQASDFQNTEMTDLIQSVSPDYSTDLSGYLIRDENGDLGWYYTGMEDGYADAAPAEVIGIYPVEGDDETYTATVRYDWYIPDETGGEGILKGSSDVTFRLKYDESSQGHWAVVSLQAGVFEESEEYQEYLEKQISEAVYSMADLLSDWAANASFVMDPEQNSSVGKIYMNTNRAVELACYITPGDGGYQEEYDVRYFPEDELNTSLKKLFGSQYQLSDFTNTIIDSVEGEEYASAFSEEYPSYWYYSRYVYRTEDGKFHEKMPGMGGNNWNESFSVKGINRNNDSTCTATVEYVVGTGGWGGPTTTYSMDVQYDLIPDESAEYGWAITAITFGDKY